MPTSILNLFFVGEGPPPWLATGALACRSGVALQSEPGAPQPIQKQRFVLGFLNFWAYRVLRFVGLSEFFWPFRYAMVLRRRCQSNLARFERIEELYLEDNLKRRV